MRQCELLDLCRSSLHYQPTPISEADLALMRHIDELYHPFLEARRLARVLQREDITVGRRHMGTLMQLMGIEAIYRTQRTSLPDKGHRIYPYLLATVAMGAVLDRGPAGPALVRPQWLGEFRGGSRCREPGVWGARFARQGRAIEAVDALEQGILQHYGRLAQVPEGLRLRHDNGSIFLARRFVDAAQHLAITQEFIPRYSPEYNGVIARCFRTLKQECVWLHHCESFEEAERIITAWIDHYNTERHHSALGYLTPRVWREQCDQLPQAA